MNKDTKKEKKIKIKGYVYNFDDEKIKEYEKIKNDWFEDRKNFLNETAKKKGSGLYLYNSKRCRFLEEDIMNLHFLILDLFKHYGFGELFKYMEEYEDRILENLKEEELAVDNTNKNKNLENLRNRIGLIIYYLYETRKNNNNITIKDVNKLTELVNEIMDITEFLNKYLDFYSIYLKGLLENKDVREIFGYGSIQDLFKLFYYENLLGGNFETKMREKKKLITDFHENFKRFLINNVYELLNYKVSELYDILKKGNEKINLIENEPEKIEEAFRKHVYLKDNKYSRLLDANKSPGKYEDVIFYLKDNFFEKTGMNLDEIFN